MNPFTSGIFRLLFSRFTFVSLGVIALCVLIWKFGSLLAIGDMHPLEPAWARACLIGLIILWLLVRLLIARWRSGRMNERIANMLRSSLSTDTAEDKVQTGVLKDRFAEALTILRKARFESGPATFWSRIIRRGRYVYELPWYVIIGAPGVGKTTALINSGLSFPLSSQIGAAAIRGAGGTRNCDWWFTNEAVFIDTAGRYTTHETDVQTDKAEWRGFLSLLKKNRPQQPINGVLLMMSVAELLGQNREECQKSATTLRQRLDELRNDLGMSFPVYLLINKCDLLLGFDEYFSRLDRSGRAQVWGTTLQLSPTGKYAFDLGLLASEFNLLQARIADGLVDVLQAESVLSRRELIYAFPQQFAALTQILEGMLSDLLETSRFSESPFLRGIYFTSATQEGTPFDRIVHALGQGFQVQRPQKAAVAGEGKAYFLHELLSKVVFGEAHIAGQDRRAERRSYAWHTGGYALSVFVLAGATMAWATSRHNNVNYLDEVNVKVARMGQTLPSLRNMPADDIRQLLPVLNDAESLLNTPSVEDVDHPRLGWRFGLFQGTGLKVKVRGERGLYGKLLSTRLGPAIEATLEKKLRLAVDSNTMESSSGLLKAYLMIYEPNRLNEASFVDAINISLGGESGKDLARHIKALIAINALSPSKRKDDGLVSQSRTQLRRQTTEMRVFEETASSREFYDLEEFSMLDVEGHMGLLEFRSGNHRQSIPGLYTRAGYELFKKKRDRALSRIVEDEAWLLGIDEGSAQNAAKNTAELRHDVDVLYAKKYINTWQGYIDNVVVVKPRSLAEAEHIVKQLSLPESPLLLFYKRVAQETELVKEPDKGSLPNSVTGPKDDPAMLVNIHFAELRKSVNGNSGDGSDAPILRSMQEFKKIQELLALAIDAANALPRRPMPDTSYLRQLQNLSPREMPGPIRSILKDVAGGSSGLVEKETDRGFLYEQHKQVTEPCTLRKIPSLYPFNPGASASVPVGDFAAIFGPDGVIERFRQIPQYAPHLPIEYDYAKIIKEAFFRAGDRPEFSFSIEPVQMDGSITSMNLTIGRQHIRYAHGASQPTTITWPDGDQQVRLSLQPQTPSGTNEINLAGLWALHQLFKKHGHIRPGGSPDVFTVEVGVGGRRATFKVTTTSRLNPFTLPELGKFRCPTGMRH